MTAVIIISALLLSPLFILWLLSPGRLKPYKDSSGRTLPNSISEKIWVPINGVNQGMIIQGKDINNPVILFLHGGPGVPMYYLCEKPFAKLQEDFTLCYWEQRGAGLSWKPGMDPDTITANQLIADTISVAGYLCTRFKKEKVMLMACSWGSFIGIQAAYQAPEYFSSYIGIGQIADEKENERLAWQYLYEECTKQGNRNMIQKLDGFDINSEAGIWAFYNSPVRESAQHALGVGSTHAMRSVITGIFLPSLLHKAYTLKEKINYWRAKVFLAKHTALNKELFEKSLLQSVTELKIPTYFLSGTYDYTVNKNLSKAYLELLQAPVKRYIEFMHSAHSPMLEEPERFVKLIREISQTLVF